MSGRRTTQRASDGVVPISRAVRDPDLLGGAIGWWARQLDLLDSLGGPEQLHAWAVARQAGKSSMCAAAAVHNATMRPDLDAMLPAGRVRYVLCGAPSESQSREFIGLCEVLIDGSPLLSDLALVRADRIDFHA